MSSVGLGGPAQSAGERSTCRCSTARPASRSCRRRSLTTGTRKDSATSSPTAVSRSCCASGFTSCCAASPSLSRGRSLAGPCADNSTVRGRRAGQERARPAHVGAGPRRHDRRVERGHPGGLHQPLGAGRLGLRRDDRPLRRHHRGWGGQCKGADPRRHAGAAGLRRVLPIPPGALEHGARAGARMGGHRTAHHRVPLVPARWDLARATPNPRWISHDVATTDADRKPGQTH